MSDARLVVWISVEDVFTDQEANKTTNAEFTRDIAERILSGRVRAEVVKCSTIFDREVTA